MKKRDIMHHFETWNVISGHPDYLVSSFGKVFSVKSNRVLKPFSNPAGYKYVNLGSDYRYSVHYLVGITFLLDSHFDGAVINHKDGVKSNNKTLNLEWVTQSENNKHAYKTGLKIPSGPTGKTGVQSKIHKKVYHYSLNGDLIAIWNGVRDAARNLGIAHSSIGDVCRGKYSQSHGYAFSYQPKKSLEAVFNELSSNS